MQSTAKLQAYHAILGKHFLLGIALLSLSTALQARAEYTVTQQHTEQLLGKLANQIKLSKQRSEALATQSRRHQVMLFPCICMLCCNV